jgi:hypothetical protein
MPPLWQYFSRVRPTSPSLSPKGVNHGSRSIFPCKTAFLRDRSKGPSTRSRTPEPAAAVLVSDCPAPAVAVLLAAEKRRCPWAEVGGEGDAPVGAVLGAD